MRRSSGSRVSTVSMSKLFTMIAVLGMLRLRARTINTFGYLVRRDGSQAAQVLPRPRGVAQDVDPVLGEPGGTPLADDDPGQHAGPDQLGQQIDFGRGQRGRGMVAADQVERGP